MQHDGIPAKCGDDGGCAGQASAGCVVPHAAGPQRDLLPCATRDQPLTPRAPPERRRNADRVTAVAVTAVAVAAVAKQAAVEQCDGLLPELRI
eukprot:scaffold19651_cov112-Isochrysis_galbana.AAC.2